MNKILDDEKDMKYIKWTQILRDEKSSKDIDTINVIRQNKYEKRNLEIKNNICAKRNWHNNIDVQIKNTKFTKLNIFPSHILIQNNISCLQQYNNFITNDSFKPNYCSSCNENFFWKELIMCNIKKLNKNMKNMNILFKFEQWWYYSTRIYSRQHVYMCI
jgi:hypothetical protein